MKKLSLLCLLLSLSTIIFADDKIIGEWANNCEGMPFSRIYTDGGANKIQLASNQIYINVLYKLSDNPGDGVDILFEKPSSLGRGGAGFPWGEFSRSKPLGKFKKVTEKEAILEWYGFYTNKGKFIEVPSDFSKSGRLYKCSN